MAMETKEIKAAIQSIPKQKEELRKAFESLQSFSSAFVSFTLQWKQLDDYFSSVQSSIESRFQALRSLESSLPSQSSAAATAATVPSEPNPPVEPEISPRSELMLLCTKMDGKNLCTFIIMHRKDNPVNRDELIPALRAAPDAAALVLDALDGFYSDEMKSNGKDGEILAIRRTCINLLQRVQELGPEIKQPIKDKAKKVAVQWKAKVSDDGDDLEAHGFLQLLVAYKLVDEFKVDEVLDVVVLVARRKQTIELCKVLGVEMHIPELIQKLINKGKQLDAVKYIQAFNLIDKYPPVPLLKSYLKATRKAVQEIRLKGNYSTQNMNDAMVKELGALKSVLRAIEEYGLESEYPREHLQKRITQLERQKAAEKKRTATDTAASNSKMQQQQQQRKQHQQTNKRPRPLTASTTPTVASYPPPPLVRNQPQLGMPERASFMGSAGSYGIAGPSTHYHHAGHNLLPATAGLGGLAAPPSSYLYPSEHIVGSGLYDRSLPYGGYSISGLSTPYGPAR
ncbi:truncated FRIGIDA-like protein 1 [Dioscorea cayenensis subsp. rotundata]|uniref:FRIGIDA-like protein n=1 Tax=Dioscorea cayennensis subsp. rotundata TaxID=55577 RepID=A0AB40AIV7_DIOCR|nr:truncated FRIGIDA-like protein 1 [Dioscorea cayenensis subsp. rotundata]